MSGEHDQALAIRREPPLSNARLGMILFIASEAMLFGGLLAGYVVLRFGSNHFAGMERPPAGLATAAIAALLASSGALIVAGRARIGGSRGIVRGGVLIALLLGALFLALRIVEWSSLAGDGVSPSRNLYGGMFHILTWAHGLHAAGGLVLLAIVALRALSGRTTARWERFAPVAALYWHFVAIVGLVLFLLLFVV